MYNHGFSTLALAEAYGAVDDPRLGPALQKAVRLIVSAQEANSLHAWRYSPDAKDADTTVSGAQMVALFAARNAGIPVPENVDPERPQVLPLLPDGGGWLRLHFAHRRPMPRAQPSGAWCWRWPRKRSRPPSKSAFAFPAHDPARRAVSALLSLLRLAGLFPWFARNVAKLEPAKYRHPARAAEPGRQLGRPAWPHLRHSRFAFVAGP